MKFTTTILCVIFGLLVFENKDASSISPECLNDLKCGLQSLLKRWQVDLIGKKSNSSDWHGLLQKLFALPTPLPTSSTTSPPTTTAAATVTRDCNPHQISEVRKRNDSPANSNCIRTPEELVTFLSSSSSVADSTPTKMRAAIMLLVSFRGSLPSPLPAAAVVNLVEKLVAAPQLFVGLPQPAVNVVLMVTTAANACATGQLPADLRVRFLHAVFSLSPGALVLVPKSVMVPVLGTITSPDMLDALPGAVTVKLVTVLSLSRPLFLCMPVPALLSLLSSVAARSPQELLTALPPSTLFGFLDGLLHAARDASPILADAATGPVLAAVLGPLMTSRLVSVLPAPTLDLFLAVVGSSPELAGSLPASCVVSVFGTLAKSPNLLSSLDPNHLAKALVTVMNTPSAADGLPPTMFTALLDAVAVYLPSCFDCIPIADLSPGRK